MISMVKDPDAVLDFSFDWGSKWLTEGETITEVFVDVEESLNVDSVVQVGGLVTVWLSGGVTGENCALRCRVVTTSGRVDDRTMTIRVRER